MRTWKPIIDGPDIVIGDFTNPVTGSWFGGPSDTGDNGQTASGVDNTKMGTLGCSLPMRKSNGILVPGCASSPFESFPWHTMVEVNVLNRNAGPVPVVGSQLTLPLIDVGPETDPVDLNRPIRLTPFAFVRLGGDLKMGLLHCFIRILGGAKYLTL